MPDGVILSGIVGSTAYGMAHDDSDIDRLGCYVEPTEAFFGLNPPTRSDASRVTTNPDVTMHEVGKYLHLLLGCNPTVTELLWLPLGLYEVIEIEGSELIEMRLSFLSAPRVHDAYLGYAKQQFTRLQDRGGTFSADTRKRTAKHARHLRRLCWQGFTLYSTGELAIRVENPEEYFEFGGAVAERPTLALDLIQEYSEKFDKALSILPERPDTQRVEDWLVRVRRAHLD